MSKKKIDGKKKERYNISVKSLRKALALTPSLTRKDLAE